MSKTRRRAKDEAAAAAAASSTPGPSQDDDNSSDILDVSIPDELDQEHLAEILPEIPDLTSVTPDVVVFLYELVAKQYALLDTSQRELDDLKADNERKDVELEQAFLEKESLSKELDTTVASVQEELAHLKQAGDKLAEENAALKAQLSTLSESQSSSSSEVESLKHQVEEIEREKRDLLSVISRSKQDEAQREEEVQSLRNTLKEARQDHQQLESRIRELRSAETSTKFKLDTLTQQLHLAQTEAERSNAELSTKTEEYAKYRRTKHAEMLALQSSFDSLSQEHMATQASLKALQSAHSAQTNQLTQALSKIQALTGQIAEQEARYASEANGLKRLVQMMEEREKQAKEIVEGIEAQWSSVGEKAERRENALKDQLEHEARRREEAEKRVEQLETVLGRMGRGELPAPGTPLLATPGTPGGGEFDGMLGLSPTVALASKSQRKGKTFTEVYADYVRLQEEYAKKCVEHDQMDRTLSAVLAEIEERAPLLSQQRLEYERVKIEASELSAQLAQAISDRDSQAKLAEEQGQKLKKATAESNLLQQQLNDLGRQIQNLLREIARKEDPTIPPHADLENIPFQPADNVNEIITNNLVLFLNIEGLQEQNQKLLRITRELGEKLEGEERDYKEAMQQEQAEAIREAHEAMQDLAAQLEQQKKHSESVIQAYVKERDALKLMLSRAQAAASRAFINIDVSNQPTGQNHALAPVSDSEVARELVEVQQQFEAYKMEMGVDATRLRDELTNAQREVHELSASLAKANAKVEYLNERHRVHSEEYQLTHRQLEEVAKRNQTLFDQWTRADIECGRLSEDLHVANGRLEQLRNECANLRAEKQIWEGVQARLMDENKTLAMERSHLSDIIGNVQKMHNDLERTGEINSRRLESQIKMFEGQVQDLRTQLARERESVRHIGLQKDLETKEMQSRLDKANLELSKTREGLVGAETSKQHLEQRVADLTKQLQALEEKIGVYEHRPSTTTIATLATNPDLSREQQLEQEVAELRSALKVAEVDLTSARGHVEQFKEISQANEVALSNLNSTFDEYKTSTEAQIARHEAEYKVLQGKLEAADKELTELREQHASAQKVWEEERVALKNDKKTLEETIIDMSTSEKHLESDRSSREQEVRAIEERAKSAEERYSHEIVAHAESIKLIETLRRDLSTAQDKARENQAASETAVAKLAASEQSWNQQKEILDKEIADLNARCRDLASQNSLLHHHLESVSSQAAKIRQAATDSGSSPAADGDTTEDADTKLADLRSLVSYLRREKEIVDLQLDVTKQENTRLKNRVEDLSQSLQEARSTLSEERERAVQSAASASQHAELMERINQLNILRESNAMLRAESESHAKKARDLETKLEKLTAELDPAKEQARLAQAELEAARGQLQRLEQESHGWQERNKQLLSKYDRVDPAEVQALKDEVEKAKPALEELKQARAQLEQELATKQAELETQQKTLESTNSRFQEFQTRMRTKLSQMNSQQSNLSKENKELQAKLEAAQSGAATTAPISQPAPPDPALTEELKKKEAALAAMKAERDKLAAEKETWSKSVPPIAATSDAPANWEAEKAELVKARDDALQKVKEADGQVQKVNAELRNIKMQNDKFHTRLEAMAKARAGEQERADAAIAKAKSEMQAAGDATTTEELEKKHAEALDNLRKEFQTKYEVDLKAAIEAASKQGPISEGQQAAIEAALAEQKKALEEGHAKEIEAARESGRKEVEMKMKVKDSQLTKATNKAKQLETMVLEWEKTGVVPQGSVTKAVSTAPAAAATRVPPVASVPPVQAGQKPAVPPAAGVKPSPTAPATSSTAQSPAAVTPAARKATTPTAAAARGGAPTVPAARGGTAAARGGAAASRGGAPTRGQRGGVPLGVRNPASRPLPVKQTTPSGGISIAGAAAAAAASTAGTPNTKRPREESDGAAQDETSLAKRLKPADTAAASGTPAGGAKVQLRRPPPGS